MNFLRHRFSSGHGLLLQLQIQKLLTRIFVTDYRPSFLLSRDMILSWQATA